MKILSITSLLFLNLTTAHASLERDYQLIAGPKLCPIGAVSLRVDAKAKERTLIFGSQLAWVLNMEDKSSVKEITEGGCTYVLNYEKSENNFLAKTTRSSCPQTTENGVITESMELKNDKLQYQYEFKSAENKSTSYKCTYNKRN